MKFVEVLRRSLDRFANCVEVTEVVFFASYQHLDVMVRNLLLLTLLLARPKSRLCHHMRLGELIEMEIVEGLLVNIRQAQDAFVSVNLLFC